MSMLKWVERMESSWGEEKARAKIGSSGAGWSHRGIGGGGECTGGEVRAGRGDIGGDGE